MGYAYESQQRGRQLWGLEERGSEVKEKHDWEGLNHPFQDQPFLPVYPQPLSLTKHKTHTCFKGKT